MIIDIIAIITIIVFGIWGARRGLIKQIAAIASIVLMFLFASPIADILVNIISDNSKLNIPPRYLHIFLVSISATAIFVIINLIGAFLHKTLVAGVKPVETANKAFGFTTGLILSALVIYFVMCLSNCAMGWITQYAPSLGAEIQNSVSYAITKEFNLIEEQMPELAKKTGKPAETSNAKPDADDADRSNHENTTNNSDKAVDNENSNATPNLKLDPTAPRRNIRTRISETSK